MRNRYCATTSWELGIDSMAILRSRAALSTELRKWFDHGPEKWADFQRRYCNQLEGHTSALRNLIDQGRERQMTLLFGANDRVHNHAVMFKGVLEAN